MALVFFGINIVADAQKPKSLEDENWRLNKLLAEQILDNTTLKEMLGKNF